MLDRVWRKGNPPTRLGGSYLWVIYELFICAMTQWLSAIFSNVPVRRVGEEKKIKWNWLNGINCWSLGKDLCMVMCVCVCVCVWLLLYSLKIFENFRNKRKKTEANVKEFHIATSKLDSLSNRSNDLKSTRHITSLIKYRK